MISSQIRLVTEPAHEVLRDSGAGYCVARTSVKIRGSVRNAPGKVRTSEIRLTTLLSAQPPQERDGARGVCKEISCSDRHSGEGEKQDEFHS